MTDCSQLAAIAQDLKIGEFSRHVLLCIGETCCSSDQGRAAWSKLKNLLKERNLSLATGPNACYRTKVDCLRICKGGPILVVYPEGLWYAGMTEDRIERFVEEQLVQGRPIEEWIFARNPLPLPTLPENSA
ncbi:MAG: (2Fe-2S) ferredoxin domain-containing protein [Planctomycetota bacterium]|jgi:(2Fe-2S) ferredoxin